MPAHLPARHDTRSRYTVVRCIGTEQRLRASMAAIPCSTCRTSSRLAAWRWSGEHQRVALTWQKLAYLYQKTGKCKEAEIFYQRALSFQEKELEFSHLDTVKAIEGYASLLRELGRDEEAIALEERIKTI